MDLKDEIKEINEELKDAETPVEEGTDEVPEEACEELSKELEEEPKEEAPKEEEPKEEEPKEDEPMEEEPKDEEPKEEPKEEEPKRRIKFWHVAVGFVGTLLLLYVGVSVFFVNHFYINTVISGNDCSGKSIKGVVDTLEEQAKNYVLTIEERDGTTDSISSSDISLSHNMGDVLEKAMENQNPFLWPLGFFAEEDLVVSLEMNYDEEALKSEIIELHCMSEEMQVAPISATPSFNGITYEIENEILGTQIDEEKFHATIEAAIANLDTEISLEEDQCYVAPKYVSDSPEVIAACEKARTCANTLVTYSAGKKTMVVDAQNVSKWISFDEEMQLTFDDALMKKYVKKLAKTFNTVGAIRTIKTPTGKKVEVSGGTYGRVVDQKKELTKLKNNINAGKQVTREPACSQKVASSGKYEWGDTYLEVDITEQHMWYLKDGEVVFESDVVTGTPTPDRNTPQGVYTILEKMRNKTLRGQIMPNGKPEYLTPVSYWMRVTWSGIGFHDATWQRAFGGTRYKQGYGSHGCINMPLSGVSTLYEMVEKGCPVIIHY